MVAHDFAHIEVAQEDLEKPLTNNKSIVLTLSLIVLVLGAFVGGFWLGQKHGIEVAAGEDKARLEALLKEQKDEMDVLRAKANQEEKPEVSTTQVGELTFYNDLPKQAVQPSPLHEKSVVESKKTNIATPSATPSTVVAMRKMIADEMQQGSPAGVAAHHKTKQKSAVGQEKYLLQVGSFQRQADAAAFLPKLTKHGFSAMIRRVELPKLGVWYRVYLGDYASRQAADKAKVLVQKTLRITGLIVKKP